MPRASCMAVGTGDSGQQAFESNPTFEQENDSACLSAFVSPQGHKGLNLQRQPKKVQRLRISSKNAPKGSRVHVLKHQAKPAGFAPTATLVKSNRTSGRHGAQPTAVQAFESSSTNGSSAEPPVVNLFTAEEGCHCCNSCLCFPHRLHLLQSHPRLISPWRRDRGTKERQDVWVPHFAQRLQLPYVVLPIIPYQLRQPCICTIVW